MGKKILVPVSGGKDSTACLVKAIDKVGKEFVQPVFNDTGWEHPQTYAYLEYLECRLGVKILQTVGGNRKNGSKADTLPNLIRAQGRFPFGLGRFCTTHLKQYALRDVYKNTIYDGSTQWEFWFGMRQDESGQRKRKYNGITPDDVFDMEDLFPSRYNKKLRKTISVRLPIVDMKTEDVFLFLKNRGINVNPLYFEGTNDRVGCYPCLLASRKIQERIFATEEGKKRLEIIKQLEKELGVKYEMYDTDQGSCELCKI